MIRQVLFGNFFVGSTEYEFRAHRLCSPDNRDVSSFLARFVGLRLVGCTSDTRQPHGAANVTNGITQRRSLESGSNRDRWSILFRLINERSGSSNISKAKPRRNRV